MKRHVVVRTLTVTFQSAHKDAPAILNHAFKLALQQCVAELDETLSDYVIESASSATIAADLSTVFVTVTVIGAAL